MNYKNSLAMLLLLPVWAFAQLEDPICKLNHYQPRYVSWLPETPSYFAKIHPDGKFAFFIGSGNRILNLEERDLTKRLRTAPGSIDPVPCPDGKLLTVPGMSLYETSAVLKEGDAAKPLLTDYDLGGVYQSCAVLSAVGRRTTYRVVTDSNGEVSYRDYQVKYFNSQPAQVTPLREATLRCPEMNLKTIIISKTGKYLSAYLPEQGTTKIFNIEGRTGACKEVADIGYATGKLEFNYDDTRIAFHVDYFSSQAGDYFSGVSNDMSKDVFTLDIARGSGGVLNLRNLRRISTARGKGSGSYYPSFAKNGDLLFLNDDGNFYSFHNVRPDRIPAYAPLLPPPDGWPGGRPPAGVPADWNEKLHAASVVGSLWSKRCSPDDDEVSAAEAASVKLVLPTSTCKSLVQQDWVPGAGEELSKHARYSRDQRFDPEKVRLLSAVQLLAACGDTPDWQDPLPVEYGSKFAGQLNGSRLIQHYCVGCHVVGGALRLPDGSSVPNTLHFSNLQEWQIEASLARLELPVGQGRMPPAGFELGSDHKSIIAQYLDCRLRQLRHSGPEYNRPYCD